MSEWFDNYPIICPGDSSLLSVRNKVMNLGADYLKTFDGCVYDSGFYLIENFSPDRSTQRLSKIQDGLEGYTGISSIPVEIFQNDEGFASSRTRNAFYMDLHPTSVNAIAFYKLADFIMSFPTTEKYGEVSIFSNGATAITKSAVGQVNPMLKPALRMNFHRYGASRFDPVGMHTSRRGRGKNVFE